LESAFVVSKAVTTDWGTELGTTLLNGFDNTTDYPAYFHLPGISSVCTTGHERSSFPSGPGRPGRPLLRNTRTTDLALRGGSRCSSIVWRRAARPCALV